MAGPAGGPTTCTLAALNPPLISRNHLAGRQRRRP